MQKIAIATESYDNVDYFAPKKYEQLHIILWE